MSYYVYDGSGLSVVCLSVLSFCLHACKLTCMEAEGEQGEHHKGSICSNFSMYKELPEDGYM